jgi:hypothetical protein
MIGETAMRNRTLVALAVIIASGLVLVFGYGCGVLQESPSSVVKEFFALANEGKYTDAEKLLSTEFKGALNGVIGQMTGGIKGLCDDVTKNGTLTRVEVVSEEVRGEGATVIAKLHFKDGSTKEDKTALRKENGKWRIAP